MENFCSPLYDSPYYHTAMLIFVVLALGSIYGMVTNKEYRGALFVKAVDIGFLLLVALLSFANAFSGCGGVFTGFFPFNLLGF